MAAEQMRPASKEQAPDPSDSYERANPLHESATGRLDAHPHVPENNPDRLHRAVSNRQDPTRQINGEDPTDQRPAESPALPSQPDHSMKDEEPLGSDMAPADISNPQNKRHPHTGGKGGTPDVGEAREDG